MKKNIKRAMALILVVSTFLALLALTSCGGVPGKIEGFLSSDSYTYKTGKFVVKKDDTSVYYTNGSVEKYLYYDKEAKNYYYGEISPEGKATKTVIDSEKYIDYHENMVSAVAEISKFFTGFLQVSDMLTADESGGYSFEGYKVMEADGVITCTKEKTTMTVSEVGSTSVEIPEKIASIKATR